MEGARHTQTAAVQGSGGMKWTLGACIGRQPHAASARQPMLDCSPARPPVCDLRLSASLPVARPACKRQTQAMRAALLGFRPAPALVAPRRPHGFAGALPGHTSMRYAASRHPSVSAHTVASLTPFCPPCSMPAAAQGSSAPSDRG